MRGERRAAAGGKAVVTAANPGSKLPRARCEGLESALRFGLRPGPVKLFPGKPGKAGAGEDGRGHFRGVEKVEASSRDSRRLCLRPDPAALGRSCIHAPASVCVCVWSSVPLSHTPSLFATDWGRGRRGWVFICACECNALRDTKWRDFSGVCVREKETARMRVWRCARIFFKNYALTMLHLREG